ncbi:uncharacterized protein LOC133191024 [Saccostrea echinata]|uniref:uncharacterized protein LOC133191024 n=1 Tax=Saccostrea echinata TaxID=191078 RepID=UPI002A811B02|nr:uncharacterized protein LOC133191024 [Saccostrea echinata]
MFKPVDIGDSCPLDETAWNQKKSTSNCSGVLPYHCIPDNRRVPGEICIGLIWVPPNYCPVYNLNAEKLDVEACDLQRGICSNKDFQSPEVYKYTGCLNITRQKDQSSGGTENSQPLPLLPIIVGSVSFVCLVVVIACIFCLCRRRGSSAGKKEKDVELQQPLVETFPPDFHRICHYLSANVFYPTKVYTKSVGLFEVHGSLLLIGPHGSGKTTIAVNLLSKKVNTTSNGKRCFVEVCKSVEEIASKIDESTVTFVLLDDALEQYAYQESLLDTHLEVYEELKRLIEIGYLRIICTVTDTIWNTFRAKFSQCPFFSKEFQIELNDKTIDRHEKEEILKTHLQYNKFVISKKKKDENLKKIDKHHADNSQIVISEDTIKSWAKKAKAKNGVGIPLLFDLISTNKSLFVNADTVLSDSLESVLKMRILHLRKDSKGALDKDFGSILIFAAFCGGKVSVQDFVDKESVYVEICSKIGCSKKGVKEIEGLLNMHEMGSYFYPLRGCYIFHHKILTALILSSTVKDNEELVLQHADLDVLYRTLQSQKSKYPLCVKVSEKSLTSLTDRIGKETPDVIGKWQNHVIMQSEKPKKRLMKAMEDCRDGEAQEK